MAANVAIAATMVMGTIDQIIMGTAILSSVMMFGNCFVRGLSLVIAISFYKMFSVFR